MLNAHEGLEEENVNGRLPELLIPPMNVPVPPIAEPEINPQICHSYYSYGMHHDEKVSNTEQN